jgi:predicted dehydrogenase
MTGPALRAGIVGYGYMGEIRRRNVEDHPDLTLVGVVDPRVTDGPKLGITLFPTHEALIAEGLDVVFVCTPNRITPDVTVYALGHGCHVFCEKPPGRTVADIERIRDAERANPHLKLIFGFNHRHHPGITEAKAIADSGALGRILYLRGAYGKSGGDGFEKGWRNDPEMGGGGILLDQGIHMLDLFRFFVGDFEEVSGMTSTTYWDIPVEDNAFLILRTPAGQVASLHSSATSWKHTFRLEIGLEKGYLTVSGLLSKTGSYGRETLLIGRRPVRGELVALGNPREELTYYDSDPSWDLQVCHFVECIREGTPIADSTSIDALRVMEIVERVYRTPDNAAYVGRQRA